MLTLCGLAIVQMSLPAAAFDHRTISFERALTLEATEKDPAMRHGARWVLDDSMRKAIAALEKAAQAGDDEAAAMLSAWRALLDH